MATVIKDRRERYSKKITHEERRASAKCSYANDDSITDSGDEEVLFEVKAKPKQNKHLKKDQKKGGKIWNQLASNLNGIPDSGLNTTQRGVRTQYDKLIEDFDQKEREEKKATGIDADYDELDQLLNDTYERASDAAADLARQAKEKEKAACDEKQQAEDIRTQAMERQEKKQPNKRKSTVLKELLEEGRKSKNEMEMKRIALEEQCLQADKERHTFFENVVTKQQQQQVLLLNQQMEAQAQQQQMMKLHLENQQQQQYP
ncbi:PREDICTED: forkhead box protein P2-like [Acropora digitifera]|uniref:forkhead box protein P2-like n=1 Tax=Acropora digitifera TaxID=70779 RepID=UPI00077AE376|nr:PREDICTED: forkhead box protein P2-like [Acropora digitifera]